MRMGMSGQRARLLPAIVVAMLLGLALLDAPSEAQSVSKVILTQISTPFNSPIGIDHHAPTDSVVLSVNYPSGEPYNFERVDFDGRREQFSSLSGLDNEIKIATVRESDCQGGFEAGALFTGTGRPGEIARIAPDGSRYDRSWVQLNGETGLMRGGMFQDLHCVHGGRLVVVTTAGGVWLVPSSGQPTRMAKLGVHLEGVITVPDEPERYGPWAGMILAGAESQNLIYAIGRDRSVTPYALGIAPEDIDLVPPGANFFGVDYGAKRLVGAPASEWLDKVGDIVIAQESGPLWDLRWNPGAAKFDITEIARVSQWEHVTFSTAGIIEIPTPTPYVSATPSPTVLPSETPRPSETPTPSPTPSPSPSPSSSPTAFRASVYLPASLRDACVPKALDIALVIDLSTSMLREIPGGDTKLDAVQEAARAFVEVLGPAMDEGLARVALVVFNDRARRVLHLVGDRQRVLDEIEGLPAHLAEGTRLDLALGEGARALEDARSDALTSLILLTDGLPNRVPTPTTGGGQEETVLEAAEKAREAGIRIHTIGVGSPTAADPVDRIHPDLLRGIAGDPKRYLEAASRGALIEAYRGIALSLGCGGDGLGANWP
jgi:hypothetical protein